MFYRVIGFEKFYLIIYSHPSVAMRQLHSRGALCIEITFVGATISRTLCISQYKATPQSQCDSSPQGEPCMLVWNVVF